MSFPRVLAYPLFALPWIGVVLVIGWLLLVRFPPDGVVSFTFPFDGKSPWFDPFLPGERVTSPGVQQDGWVGQRIFREPVYASARLPGAMDTYTLALEMRTIRQPLLELGVQQSPGDFAFQLQPLWYEPLSEGWRRVVTREATGYVRSSLPDSALLETPAERMVLWHATMTSPLLSDTPLPEPEMINASLRGAMDLYVVPVDGAIRFSFLIQDMNRSRGGDVVAFHLSKEDGVIATEAVGTGGTHSTRPDRAFEKRVTFRDLTPGVYRLQVLADDDVFFRRIETPHRRWVIGPRVYFADAVGYATSTPSVDVWTNSRHISLQTFHKEGIQRVTFGSTMGEIERTHEVYPVSRSAEDRGMTARFRAPLGDVRFVGDGYVAFRESALFFPKPRRLTDQTRLEEEGIDVVRTSYVAPTVLPDGWFRAEVQGTVPPFMDRLRIALSAPGILLRQGGVDIRTVRVTYRRPPMLSGQEWWRSVRAELVQAWRRL